MGQVIQISHMVKKIDNPPNRLRAIRMERKPRITLRHIAEAMGTTQIVISRFETGERPLSMPTAKRIAAVLGVTLSDLLNPEDNPYQLDGRERAVIDAMRSDDGNIARTVSAVAESLTTFAHRPEEEEEAPRKRA